MIRPPEKVDLFSANEVKLTHLIFRLRQHLKPRSYEVTVLNSPADLWIHVHHPKYNLEYVPEGTMSTLAEVADIDGLAEFLAEDIMDAFGRGEEEFCAGR
jgi:hypothetical protein